MPIKISTQEEETYKRGGKMQVLQIHDTDKKPLSISKVKEIASKITDKYKDDKRYKFIIRGLGSDMWYTLKSKDQDEVNYMDEEEYLQDRPKNSTKFQQYYQLQITILKSN
jgi:hypothetical protein